MTVEQVPAVDPAAGPEEDWEPYAAALALVVAAAVAETGAVFDRLAPRGLVLEELPERVRRLLIAALVRSWVGWSARAGSLASTYAAGWLSGERGAVVAPMLPPLPSEARARLEAAAETALARAVELSTGGPLADAEPVEGGEHAEADRAAVEARRAEEAADATEDARVARQEAEDARRAAAEDEAERAAIAEEIRAAEKQWEREAEAERQAVRDLLRAEAAADAEDARREAAQRAADDRQAAEDATQDRRDRLEQARADRAALRAEQAAERAENREADADRARHRRQAREDRRLAQRARAEQVARSVAAQAAAEQLRASLEHATEVVGWIRRLDADPCDRCVAWWASGGVGDGPTPTPVRPFSIRMKRHRGCQCVQVPITREEAKHRGVTNESEPRHRGKSHSRAGDTDHQRAAQPADAAGT